MRILNKFHKQFERSSSRISRRLQRIPIGGVPPGLTFDQLAELCLLHLGEPLKHVAYVHLSRWKAAGAYRLLLKTSRGRSWRLIYKNAIYSLDHIPGLAGLPIIPGLPEYLIYSNAQNALAQYLPEIYLCSEVIPGKHYQFLLEDLSDRYWLATRQPEIVLGLAAKLPALSRAISESVVFNQDRLLQYDYKFSILAQEYIRKNLEYYAERTASEAAVKVCKSWTEIFEMHANRELHQLKSTCIIHGDPNPSNILIHRKKHLRRIKFIDWEWAGFGSTHADLASLIKEANPEIKQQALTIFSKQDNRLSFKEHKRLYEWCQLERTLLDASYLAAQQQIDTLSSTTKSDTWVPQYIEKSLHRALHAYQTLAQ